MSFSVHSYECAKAAARPVSHLFRGGPRHRSMQIWFQAIAVSVAVFFMVLLVGTVSINNIINSGSR